jgi:hypothetical protein
LVWATTGGIDPPPGEAEPDGVSPAGDVLAFEPAGAVEAGCDVAAAEGPGRAEAADADVGRGTGVAGTGAGHTPAGDAPGGELPLWLW